MGLSIPTHTTGFPFYTSLPYLSAETTVLKGDYACAQSSFRSVPNTEVCMPATALCTKWALRGATQGGQTA